MKREGQQILNDFCWRNYYTFVIITYEDVNLRTMET